MKVYDEHGQWVPPPRDERNEDRRRDEPEPEEATTVDLTELLAGDA